MKTALATLLAAFALTTGCTHVGALSQNQDGTLSSSRASRSGEVVVTERDLGTDGRCSNVEFTRDFFGSTGGLEQRITERERCGVVELRVVEHYDLHADTHTREFFRDSDHDGKFEFQAQRTRELTGQAAALANGTAREAL